MSHRQGGGGGPDEAPEPKNSNQRRAIRAPDGGEPQKVPKVPNRKPQGLTEMSQSYETREL
jgi:hypothetical protein